MMSPKTSTPITSATAPKTITIACLLSLLLLPSLALAQSGTLTPAPFLTFLDNSGKIVSLGCVWTYTAGTTTLATTYTDSTIGTPNANPIIADSSGRFVAYLVPGTSYKFVYENVPCSASSHGSVIRTADNIAAVPVSGLNVDVPGTAGEALTAGQVVYLSDGSGAKTAGSWFRADSTNSYSSSTAGLVGMATTAIASGASGTIRVSGRVTGLSALTIGAAYYVGTTGALTSTAPINARFVGSADTTTTAVIDPNPQPATTAATIQTTTSAGTQNNFAQTAGRRVILYANNATALTITGFAAGNDGDMLDVIAIGAGTLALTHADTGSTAANRIITPTATNLTVASARLEYSTGLARWSVVSYAPLAISVLSPTVSTVLNTASATTFLSFSVPAMSNGDVVAISLPVLAKNNKGTNGTAIITYNYGAVAASDSAVTWTNSATEFSAIWQFVLQRVGTDLWIYGGSAAANNISPIVQPQEQPVASVVKLTAPTFTSAQTVTLQMTFSAADATFYLKPQTALVHLQRATQ